MNLLPGKKWFSWMRLACLAITVLILFFVLRRIDRSAFLESLKAMRVSWFALAFMAYGAALLLGGFRWHLALRLTECDTHASASQRLFLIGHFFFVVLFGAPAGDLAKSAAYVRYFRFALPKVIAAAPLDRLFGLTGSIVLAGVVAGLAAATGGFANVRTLRLEWPEVWVLGGIVLVALVGIAIIFWRPEGESWWAQTLRAFGSGLGRLRLSPGVAVSGVLLALFSQIALSSVLALNLRAVTQAPLPWAQLAWTFLAITMMSCLPFTVAGAGVREVAAITFLGLYGIPAGDCVAAAMLTLAQKLGWGAVGGIVFWREEGRRRGSAPPPAKTISVIIPTLNEEASLRETVRRVQALPEVHEIIVVDGGSKDATPELAAQLGCRLLTRPPGRGGQMRAGAMQATGDVVLLLHADTWLPANGGRAVVNCLRDETVVAGGFWKIFRDTPWLLLGSRWKCALRLLLGRRIAGDQALFIRRHVLEQVGGVPDMPLMEEFELCRRLRQAGRLALAGATLITSARRFEKLGILRTYLRMWRVSLLYRLGTSPAELSRLYERE